MENNWEKLSSELEDQIFNLQKKYETLLWLY